MPSVIYKKKNVKSKNQIICEIEGTFLDDFAVLVYDQAGSIWIEKYAETLDDATKLADQLFEEVCKQY
jgi:hypothetical protein